MAELYEQGKPISSSPYMIREEPKLVGYSSEDVERLVKAAGLEAEASQVFMKVVVASPTPAMMAMAADANEARENLRAALQLFQKEPTP